MLSSLLIVLSFLPRLLVGALWIGGFFVAMGFPPVARRAASLVASACGVGLFGTAAGSVQGFLMEGLADTLEGDERMMAYSLVSLVFSLLHATAIGLLLAGVADAGRLLSAPERP